MRIFIECDVLNTKMSGVGHFTKQLVEAYHASYPKDELILFGFGQQNMLEQPLKPDQNLHYNIKRWFPRRFYNLLLKCGLPVPIDLLFGIRQDDIVIFPNFVSLPTLRTVPKFTFVHDLAFHYYPEYVSAANRKYLARFVPRTIQKSHILTISQNTQHDLTQTYNMSPDLISVIYPFPDANRFYKASAEDVSRIKTQHKLPNEYILFIGNIEPRKNIDGIIQAYSSLQPDIKKQYGLVLAGADGWLSDGLKDEIKKHNESNVGTIQLTGYVDDKDMAGLYSGANVFVYVPHYEGFGMPPLEAMLCETPVVCSNNSSLPEAVGDAALCVDSKQPDQIATAITTILTDQKIRSDLIEKGRNQTNRFTSSQTAEQLRTALLKSRTIENKSTIENNSV